MAVRHTLKLHVVGRGDGTATTLRCPGAVTPPNRHTHLVLNESCKWQVVKQVCEVLPHICIAVLAQALIIKPIPACTCGVGGGEAKSAYRGSSLFHSVCNMPGKVQSNKLLRVDQGGDKAGRGTRKGGGGATSNDRMAADTTITDQH